MGPKRSRRSSSISEESMSVTDYNEDSLQSGSSTISTRKRKRVINSKLKVCNCSEILDKLKNARAPDGHGLADYFLKLPSKRIATDYYDVITNPIDFSKIQMHLKAEEYENFEMFETDIEQLVNNAKTYHTSSAQEYQDAVMLWHFYEQEKQNIATKIDAKAESISSLVVSGSESKPRRGRKRIAISIDDGMSDQISLATSDDSRNTSEFSTECNVNPLDAFFTSIVSQKTDEGKNISPTFTYLPSKHAYPQYYEIIKEPIDLRLIAQRIKSGTYVSIDDVERDFLLMIKNAKVFNEPKSEVYQDALELHKIVKLKRTEADNAIKVPPKPKRGRKKRAPSHVTDDYAKLQSPKEEESDGSEESEVDNELENSVGLDEDLSSLIGPTDTHYNHWQLYKTVTNLIVNGSNPADPFMKLPSKKLYPEYFLEILEPMSLLMIKAKIKKTMYTTIDEIVRDFDLVFNNAQQFNVEESGIYKEAVKLQNLTHTKKQEIFNATQQIAHESPQKNTVNVPAAPISAIGVKTECLSTPSAPKKTRPPMSPQELTQKRIQNLYQAIFTYQENNRFLRDIFMNLPSPELYPDYYKVIPEPIDLTMIRKKIDEKRYPGHMDLVQDLKLMFSNAKHFNEQDSQVFLDAVTLEKVIKKKVKNIGASINSTSRNRNKKLLEQSLNSSTTSLPSVPVFSTPIDYHTPFYRIREIFQTVKEYRDCTNRLLSEPFIKLPSKQDLPEYYEYIRKPIELSTIQHRINNERYLTVEDLMSDLNLMFDNACLFNEPDSQIYSDALILQRVALEKKAFLTKDDNLCDPPNIQETTQTILETLFQQFYEYVDEDGRFLVDSVNDIDGEQVRRLAIGNCPTSVLPDGSAPTTTAASAAATETCRLNLIKIRGDLMRRRYKRMDRLQEDVFAALKYTRTVSSIHSQAYEDAFELQKLFITLRDLHCKRGEVFLTPALNYVERYLTQDLETENKERSEASLAKPVEFKDDLDLEEMKRSGNYRQLNCINRKNYSYEVGDYVKVVVGSKQSTVRVGEITGIFVPNTDDCIVSDDLSATVAIGSGGDDGCVLRVRWFFFPQETEHRPTRRFFEREVLMTPVFQTVPMSMVVSRCFIIFVKDYRYQNIKTFAPEDIYICECRYNPHEHTFKKLKNWTYKDIKDSFVKLTDPISPVRHYSQFPTMSNNMETNEYSFPIENFHESVLQEDRSVTEFCIYYDQIVCENGYIVKLGDYVYVNDPERKQQIVRIDQLWKNTRLNVVYFSGPWFINAVDIEHLPTKVFYKKEVFLSSVEPGTHLLTSIVGKCVILCFSDYCEYRPTGYTEDDVYICELKYFNEDKVARKLKKGLKKIQLSTKALDDEIFFFSRPLVPNKRPSPLLAKCSTEVLKPEYVARLVCMSQTSGLQAGSSSSAPLSSGLGSLSGAHNPGMVISGGSTGPVLPSANSGSTVAAGNNCPIFNDEDSKDTSVNMDDSVCSMSVASSGNNEHGKRKTKKKKVPKPPSGYVLYAGEIRKKLIRENPEALFGDISKEVGQLWRNMAQTDKDVYERKASEIKKAMEKDGRLQSSSANNISQNNNNGASAPHIQPQQQQGQKPFMTMSPPMTAPGGLYTIQQQQQQASQPFPQINSVVPSTVVSSQSGGPIQYFQTSNGQFLQFVPSATASAPMGDLQQQHQQHGQQQPPHHNTAALQLIQHSPMAQPAGPPQQVIYQLAPQQQQQQGSGGQQMIMNGVANQSQPFMMSPQQQQQKILGAHLQQQAAFSPQTTVTMQQQMPPQQQQQLFQAFGAASSPASTANDGHTLILPQTNNLQGQQQQQPQQQQWAPAAPRSNRVFHSEVYQRYIDRVRRNAPTLSDWKSQLSQLQEPLSAVKEAAIERASGGNRQAYMSRLMNEVAPQFLDTTETASMNTEQVVDHLFKLRDHLLRDALNIRSRLLPIEEM